MASVPNKVYPSQAYGEYIADKVTADVVNFSTTNNSIPSGSMVAGDAVLFTGSSGTSATLYLRVVSGSAECIYKLDLDYVSPA